MGCQAVAVVVIVVVVARMNLLCSHDLHDLCLCVCVFARLWTERNINRRHDPYKTGRGIRRNPDGSIASYAPLRNLNGIISQFGHSLPSNVVSSKMLLSPYMDLLPVSDTTTNNNTAKIESKADETSGFSVPAVAVAGVASVLMLTVAAFVAVFVHRRRRSRDRYTGNKNISSNAISTKKINGGGGLPVWEMGQWRVMRADEWSALENAVGATIRGESKSTAISKDTIAQNSKNSKSCYNSENEENVIPCDGHLQRRSTNKKRGILKNNNKKNSVSFSNSIINSVLSSVEDMAYVVDVGAAAAKSRGGKKRDARVGASAVATAALRHSLRSGSAVVPQDEDEFDDSIYDDAKEVEEEEEEDAVSSAIEDDGEDDANRTIPYSYALLSKLAGNAKGSADIHQRV